jgi:hypothetical protein
VSLKLFINDLFIKMRKHGSVINTFAAFLQ